MKYCCENCGHFQEAKDIREKVVEGQAIAFFLCKFCGHEKVLEQ